MEWIVTILYIIGALVTHYIIYRGANEDEIEPQSANIACMLWPVALALWCMLGIEKIIKYILKNCSL